MKILFDQGTPAPLRFELGSHIVFTAFEMDWATLSNGRLLAVAEAESFDLLITTDQSLRYQQNLTGRKIAILVLPTTRWPKIQIHSVEITATVNSIRPGEYREINW